MVSPVSSLVRLTSREPRFRIDVDMTAGTRGVQTTHAVRVPVAQADALSLYSEGIDAAEARCNGNTLGHVWQLLAFCLR